MRKRLKLDQQRAHKEMQKSLSLKKIRRKKSSQNVENESNELSIYETNQNWLEKRNNKVLKMQIDSVDKKKFRQEEEAPFHPKINKKSRSCVKMGFFQRQEQYKRQKEKNSKKLLDSLRKNYCFQPKINKKVSKFTFIAKKEAENKKKGRMATRSMLEKLKIKDETTGVSDPSKLNKTLLGRPPLKSRDFDSHNNSRIRGLNRSATNFELNLENILKKDYSLAGSKRTESRYQSSKRSSSKTGNTITETNSIKRTFSKRRIKYKSKDPSGRSLSKENSSVSRNRTGLNSKVVQKRRKKVKGEKRRSIKKKKRSGFKKKRKKGDYTVHTIELDEEVANSLTRNQREQVSRDEERRRYWKVFY